MYVDSTNIVSNRKFITIEYTTKCSHDITYTLLKVLLNSNDFSLFENIGSKGNFIT